MSQKKYELQQSPVDERDYTVATVMLGDVDLPEEYIPKMRHIKYQNWSSCCVGFAICTAMEYAEAKAGLKPNTYSEGYLYIARDGEDEDVNGMYTRKALKCAQKDGTCQYHEYRWAHNTHDVLFAIGKGVEEKLDPIAEPFRIGSYFRLSTIDEIKQAVYQIGAAICCYPVYKPFENVLHIPEEGEKQRGRHAVTIIGWTKEGFILQDSYTRLAHINLPPSKVPNGCFLIPYEYIEDETASKALELWAFYLNEDVPRKPANFCQKVGNFFYPIAVPFVEAGYWIGRFFKWLQDKV